MVVSVCETLWWREVDEYHYLPFNFKDQNHDHQLMPPTAPPRTSSRRQPGDGSESDRRSSHMPIESFHPTADTQTYRDLLIFEERLKQNAARLVKRKKKYQSKYSVDGISKKKGIPLTHDNLQQLSWYCSARQSASLVTMFS